MNNENRYPTYQISTQTRADNRGQSSQMTEQVNFANVKGPVKVCLKGPDGSLVEQTNLSVSHTKDGKFVINPHGSSGWVQGNGQPIRAILIDSKQGGVQLPPGTRILSPNTMRHVAPAPPRTHQIRHPAPSVRLAVPSVRHPATSVRLAPKIEPQISSPSTHQPYIHPPPAPRAVYNPTTLLHEPHLDTAGGSSSSTRPHYHTPSSTHTLLHTPSTPTSSTPARWSNNSVLNGISSIGNGPSGSGSRKRVSPIQYDIKPTPTNSDRKRPRRASERGGKGLRHFSNKVCEKVKSKGVTTYLEVSEELVEEFSSQNLVLSETPSSANSFDVKNIRRRVYDALNVLCAMNIISKDKKEIRWIGLPTNSLHECRQLEKYKQEIQQRIKEKKKKAQDLMLELIAFRTLIERNREMEGKTGPLPEKSTIQVPFIILSTGPNTQIGLEVADDKTEYEFNFSELFEVHDEMSILKKMGFCYGIESGEFTGEGLAKAKSLLPKTAKPFLKELFPRKTEVTEESNLEIVDFPQQISVKHEPQELTEVQKQAIETYSFDAPTYSSGFPAYNGHSNCSLSSEHSSQPSLPVDASRDTAAANTLLSLTQNYDK